MPESSKRPIKELSKMLKVFRDAVCQSSLEVCPDKFIGIKLRCVSWKVEWMDSRVASKESLDEFGSVDWTSVPEKNNRASNVATKMPKELPDLFSTDVLIGIKTCAESKPFSFWRDCDSGDSRDFCPTPSDNKDRRFSPNRPSSPDVGNKRESALIQEGQVGSKLSGLFLYAAKRDVSSNESLFPGAPWLFSAASDNSSPSRSLNSTDCRYNNAPGNSFGLSGRYASKSKDPSNSRLPRVLSLRRAPRFSFADPTKAEAVPYSASASVPFGLSFGRFGASAPRSSKKRSFPEPPSDKYGLVSTSGRQGVAVFPVFGVCHGVS